MAHIDMDLRSQKELQAATNNVRAYAGSDQSKLVIELLDALSASYCLDLISVQPEGLVRIQSALKQVRALRDVFANDGMDSPRI